MLLDQMRRYFTLAANGHAAAPELRALLEEQRSALEERLRQMQHHFQYVERKIEYWRAVEARDEQSAAEISRELACQILGSDRQPSVAAGCLVNEHAGRRREAEFTQGNQP
jgi:hypothetical protein